MASVGNLLLRDGGQRCVLVTLIWKSRKNQEAPRELLVGSLGASWDSLGDLLVASLGLLELSCEILWGLGALLGRSWVDLNLSLPQMSYTHLLFTFGPLFAGVRNTLLEHV